MPQHARVIARLRQILNCEDHQRIAIEQIALDISKSLLELRADVEFEIFQSAVAAYHRAHRSPLWRAEVARTLTSMERRLTPQ